MSDRKYYRTVVTIEVLSEEPLGDLDGVDMETLSREIECGDYSGAVTVDKSEEVTAPQMAKLLLLRNSLQLFRLPSNNSARLAKTISLG